MSNGDRAQTVSGTRKDAATSAEPYYADEFVRLFHGDCREITEWLTADVLVVDPPYGIGYKSGQRRDTLADSIEGDADALLRDEILERWGDRPALVFGTWRISRPEATHTRLIWDTKGALGMGNVSVPWKPSDQEIYVCGYGFAGHRGSNVLRHAPVQSTARGGRLHPHQKPLSLLTDLLAKVPAGWIVADPTAGVGSVLVAAKMLGLQAVGVEIDESYCETAARRLTQDALTFEGASA